LVDGKEAALVGAVFVDAAGRRTVIVFFEKRAFEKYLAARPATIAFAATEFDGGEGFLFVEIDLDEATQFALSLTGAKFGVLDGARAKACGACARSGVVA